MGSLGAVAPASTPLRASKDNERKSIPAEGLDAHAGHRLRRCERHGMYCRGLSTWTSNMAKIMDPILLILSILEYEAIILGSFGGPGNDQ